MDIAVVKSKINSEMSTLYYNSYLVKVAMKGGGGSKISKKWLRGLCMTLDFQHHNLASKYTA